MTLGEQLREARAAKGMTLRQLARAIGVSAPFMCDVEHGRRDLTTERLQQVADVLGIDVALLEAARGYTRDLEPWLRDNPDIVALLREARRSGRPLRIGGRP